MASTCTRPSSSTSSRRIRPSPRRQSSACRAPRPAKHRRRTSSPLRPSQSRNSPTTAHAISLVSSARCGSSWSPSCRIRPPARYGRRLCARRPTTRRSAGARGRRKRPRGSVRRQSVADESTPPRITLITRPECHLCEVAKEALDRVAAASGERWAEVNVESDIELEREYGERLPVVLLDGKEHGYFRVEEERLLRDLAR